MARYDVRKGHDGRWWLVDLAANTWTPYATRKRAREAMAARQEEDAEAFNQACAAMSKAFPAPPGRLGDRGCGKGGRGR